MATKGLSKDESSDKYGSKTKMNFTVGSLRRNKKPKHQSSSNSSPPESPDTVAVASPTASPRSPMMNVIVQQSFDLASAIGAEDFNDEKSSEVSSVRSSVKEHYVGFANLPNQVFRKSIKRGFQFTLMVVGESGLGKSTLINSLFLTDLYVNSDYDDSAFKVGKTMEMNASTFELKEGGVRLQLTVVDTPGFADNIDNTDCWNAVIQNGGA